MGANCGALFASATMTVKLRASVEGREPSSVTRTVIRFVLGPWASVGVQVNTPLVALMLAPAGAPESRLKVKLLAGRSGSVAEFVTTSVLSSSIIRSAGTISTGGRFTSATMTVKLRVSLEGGEPSSVTRTVIRFVLGPSASVGVQVNTPFVKLMLAPAGAPGSKLNVRVLAGRSGSVAVLVTTNVLSSLIICSAGTVSMGARFTSVTTTVKLRTSLEGGKPSSVTRTVITFVLGP